MLVELIDNRLDDKPLANHLNHVLGRCRKPHAAIAADLDRSWALRHRHRLAGHGSDR